MQTLLHLPIYLGIAGIAALVFGVLAYAAKTGRIYWRPTWYDEREQPTRFWLSMSAYLIFGLLTLTFLYAVLGEPKI